MRLALQKTEEARAPKRPLIRARFCPNEMSENLERIKLDREEDIISIRDRLDWVRAQRVILVVPPGQKALSNPVNLKLLSRKARDLAMDLLLVTKDPLIRSLAREAGLQALSSEKGVFKALPPQAEALKPMAEEAPSILALFLITLPFLFILLIAITLFVPSARIELSPLAHPVEITLQFTADPGTNRLNKARAVVPAKKLRMELSGKGSIPTSTQKYVPDQKSSGTVIFINKTAQEVIIPPGTVVSTSTGENVKFTTVTTATLPAFYQSQAEVEIVAVDPGPQGNVGAYLINKVEGVLAFKVQVYNPSPTSGGTLKPVNVVTREDKERLKALVLQNLHQEAFQAFLSQLAADSFLIPQTVTLVPAQESYDHFVDEVADQLSLELKALAIAMTVNKSNLKALAAEALSAQVPAGYELLEEEIAFEALEAQEAKDGKYVVNLKVKAPAVARINKREIQDELRGLPIPKAMEKLKALPLQQEPYIEVSPRWFGRLPWFPFRIEVKVKFK